MKPNIGWGLPVAAAPSRAVVFLDGEIDMGTCRRLEIAVREAVVTRCREVIVDLSQVTFMDSSGLNILVAARDELAADGRRLKLRRARRAVRRLLELSGDEDLLI